MARHAWLALAKHLRDLTDGQLHRPQQGQHAKPRGIGQSGKKARELSHHFRI